MRKHQRERTPYRTLTAQDRIRMVRTAPNIATLDGIPAVISGYTKPFATVSSPTASWEWSWQAVALVLYEKGGEFKS